MLFLSTACLAIQKEKWDVIVLNVNAHTRGAPFAHRCLEPKVTYPFRNLGKTSTPKELGLPGLFGVLENDGDS